MVFKTSSMSRQEQSEGQAASIQATQLASVFNVAAEQSQSLQDAEIIKCINRYVHLYGLV